MVFKHSLNAPWLLIPNIIQIEPINVKGFWTFYLDSSSRPLNAFAPSCLLRFILLFDGVICETHEPIGFILVELHDIGLNWPSHLDSQGFNYWLTLRYLLTLTLSNCRKDPGWMILYKHLTKATLISCYGPRHVHDCYIIICQSNRWEVTTSSFIAVVKLKMLMVWTCTPTISCKINYNILSWFMKCC